MLPPIALEWREPFDYLCALTESGMDYALLYSGMQTPYSGRHSILAMYPHRAVSGDSFAPLAPMLTINGKRYTNFWIGYLGYGLKNALEDLPKDKPSYIDLPPLHMVQYETVLVFDHEMKSLTLHQLSTNSPFPPEPLDAASIQLYETASVSALDSDMTKAEYLTRVQHILDAINRGDLYQANLTRKFYGSFATAPCPARLFMRLAHVSPAPYSALLKFGNRAIVSSSPERFLQLGEDGQVEARPIKGSAPRAADAGEDKDIRDALANNPKDRAENLMIVDLMRNDLARGCVIGSVRTETLFEVTTYATVHHMSSTISGQRRPDVAPLELVAQCFPPGSMTGAPKIHAMKLCSALEPRARGVYSGAIGWFGGDGAADLSVVIRTLVLDGARFEFQVGGGIVADSTPEGEWRETLTKARGLAAALHIPIERLAEL